MHLPRSGFTLAVTFQIGRQTFYPGGAISNPAWSSECGELTESRSDSGGAGLSLSLSVLVPRPLQVIPEAENAKLRVCSLSCLVIRGIRNVTLVFSKVRYPSCLKRYLGVFKICGPASVPHPFRTALKHAVDPTLPGKGRWQGPSARRSSA